MALDTNANFVVSGATQEGTVATDYSTLESSHFQVTKISFGGTGEEPIRVTDSVGLPVDILGTPTVTISTISPGSVVGIAGNVAIFGISGATAVGVTATDLDIRSLTAGDPTLGLAVGADFVRVVGYSGGWAVGVTATNFGIRALTAGDPTTATATGADVVRVVGYSGGWAIGVTATDLDIRSLTFGSDSVSVLNTVAISSSETPFSAPTSVVTGFPTRLLRSTLAGDRVTSFGAMQSDVSATSPNEDTVRVVGLSGAYPVDSMMMGLTNLSDRGSRSPFRLNATGALFVNLEAGSIGVTASIAGANLTLAGLSLPDATTAAMTIQINGYTGAGARLIGITATDLDIRGLSFGTDSVTAHIVFDANTEVGITGAAWSVLDRLDDTIVDAGSFKRVKTDDVNAANINSLLIESGGIRDDISSLEGFVSSVWQSAPAALKVSVIAVTQPSGGTAGRVSPPINSSAAMNLGSAVLQSGVHFKSDLVNTNTTIFIGMNAGVTAGRGYPLYNGDQIFIETDNTSRIWVSSDTAGTTLYYIGT